MRTSMYWSRLEKGRRMATSGAPLPPARMREFSIILSMFSTLSSTSRLAHGAHPDPAAAAAADRLQHSVCKVG